MRLIATTPELQTYSVQKLYAALRADITQEGLTLSAAWVIGEYGDALLRGGEYEEEELVQEIKESDIVDLFSTILNSSYATQAVSEYIVTALVKLTTRFSDGAQMERVRRLLQARTADLDVEIQQRSVEYSNLFGYDQIRRGVLERMPPPEIREDQRVLGEAAPNRKKAAGAAGAKKTKKGTKQGVNVSEQDMLLDLMGGDDTPSVMLPGATANGPQSQADILADLLGGNEPLPSTGPSYTTASSVAAAAPPPRSSLLDLMDSAPPTASPAPSAPSSSLSSLIGSAAVGGIATGTSKEHQVYQKNNVLVVFQVQRNADGNVQVTARLVNGSDSHVVSSLALQVAVPKSQRMNMQPLSRDTLEPFGSGIGDANEASQAMKITGSQGVGFFFLPKSSHRTLPQQHLPSSINTYVLSCYSQFHFSHSTFVLHCPPQLRQKIMLIIR